MQMLHALQHIDADARFYYDLVQVHELSVSFWVHVAALAYEDDESGRSALQPFGPSDPQRK